jgi:hypothetical protein
LYGDEYRSLKEADNWTLNPHAIGYFVQLHFWKELGNSDLYLRLLSVFWIALGLYWLHRWLLWEQIPSRAQQLIMLLAALNPYLWKYGTQIRFYALFFAAAIVTMWRFRVWQQEQKGINTIWLALSAGLLCSAHLFGVVVLSILVTTAVWGRCRRSRLYGVAAGLLVLLFVPPVTQSCTALVYFLTNRHASLPGAGMRGLTLAMLAKIPYTFFVFVLGERVYPLWWWLSVPALAVSGLALWKGIRELGRTGMGMLTRFTLISVVCVFSILDPLAPSTLQGAAPRYAIYALPILLTLIGLGAHRRPWMTFGMLVAELAGLACLFWPAWSADSDLMNWAVHLRRSASTAQPVCILTDWRALAPVERYAPQGSRIFPGGERPELASCPSVVLASNDYRLNRIRWLDATADSMQSGYKLVSNTSVFPAQVSLYERSGGQNTFAPSRLGLPEQDLRTPFKGLMNPGTIQGFLRLDYAAPSRAVPLPPATSPFWIASNFRTDHILARGTPVMAVRFYGQDGQTEQIILRAGFETAAWDGLCLYCKPMGGWSKRMHILGAESYPGAYRQYAATIWGTLSKPLTIPASSAEVSLLLDQGTAYFFGFYSLTGLLQQ